MVNNNELIRKLAIKLEVNQATAGVILNSLKDVIFESLEEDNKIKIGDFLVIDKVDVPEREYTLPNSTEKRTKESYYKLTVKFTEKYEKRSK